MTDLLHPRFWLLVILGFFQTIWATPTPYEVSAKFAEITALCRQLKSREQVMNWWDNEHNIACFEKFSSGDKADVLAMFADPELNQPPSYRSQSFAQRFIIMDIITYTMRPRFLPLIIIKKAPQVYLQTLNESFTASWKIFGMDQSEGVIELMHSLACKRPDLLTNFVQLCQQYPIILKQLIANYPKSLLSEHVKSCLKDEQLTPLKALLSRWIKQKLTDNDLAQKEQAIYVFWLRELSPRDFQYWVENYPDQFCYLVLYELQNAISNDSTDNIHGFIHHSPHLLCYVCQKATHGQILVDEYQNRFPEHWKAWLKDLKNLRLLAKTVTYPLSQKNQKKQLFRSVT